MVLNLIQARTIWPIKGLVRNVSSLNFHSSVSGLSKFIMLDPGIKVFHPRL